MPRRKEMMAKTRSVAEKRIRAFAAGKGRTASNISLKIKTKGSHRNVYYASWKTRKRK